MGAPRSVSESGLLAALERLERRAESNASGWRLLLYAVILAPVALVAPGMFGFGARPELLVGAICISVALGLIATLYSVWMRRSMRRALGKSTIALRIASGEIFGGNRRGAIPWPWGGLLHEGVTIEEVLHRVGNDLDWYVEMDTRRTVRSARKLLRLMWLCLPAALLMALYLLYHVINILYWSSVLRVLPEDAWLVILTPWIPLMPLSFIYYRRQVWHEELARYLRRVLEADAAPDTQGAPEAEAGAGADMTD